MNPKYLLLYIIAGTVALAMVIYQLITSYQYLNTSRLVLNLVLSLAFYYLAYKTYHEKKDREMM